MAAQKIALTIPPEFLRKIDNWAKKRKKSRSRFIVEELGKSIDRLEDEEITRIYNTAYGGEASLDEGLKLAEEMLSISSVPVEENEQW
jgi:metal-responsive CopG/Arc/MetJ family transcriptional regulator